MAYDDLRGFLDTLEREGQLLRITDEVLPEPDLAAAANASTARTSTSSRCCRCSG